MKKILLILSLFFISFWTVFWNWEEKKENSSESTTVKVNIWTDLETLTWYSCSPILNDKKQISHYECTVPKWMSWVTSMIHNIIKYFTFIVLIWAVLFTVINWILYSLWWVEADLKSKVKWRIVNLVLWIILLFSTWYILQTLAPWIFK